MTESGPLANDFPIKHMKKHAGGRPHLRVKQDGIFVSNLKSYSLPTNVLGTYIYTYIKYKYIL